MTVADLLEQGRFLNHSFSPLVSIHEDASTLPQLIADAAAALRDDPDWLPEPRPPDEDLANHALMARYVATIGTDTFVSDDDQWQRVFNLYLHYSRAAGSEPFRPDWRRAYKFHAFGESQNLTIVSDLPRLAAALPARVPSRSAHAVLPVLVGAFEFAAAAVGSPTNVDFDPETPSPSLMAGAFLSTFGTRALAASDPDNPRFAEDADLIRDGRDSAFTVGRHIAGMHDRHSIAGIAGRLMAGDDTCVPELYRTHHADLRRAASAVGDFAATLIHPDAERDDDASLAYLSAASLANHLDRLSSDLDRYLRGNRSWPGSLVGIGLPDVTTSEFLYSISFFPTLQRDAALARYCVGSRLAADAIAGYAWFADDADMRDALLFSAREAEQHAERAFAVHDSNVRIW